MPLPRLLCLHGGCSNNDITILQTNALGLSKEDVVECVYLHAPHVTKQCDPGLNQFSDGPWYTWVDDSSASLSDQEVQWDESLEFVEKFCRKHGPFDGAYGFSQGSAIVTNFSHPKIWRDRFRMERCPWKFAILACGAANHHVTITSRDSNIIDIPSFHIFGKKDRYLMYSKMMAEYWIRPRRVIHIHEGGHEISNQISAKDDVMTMKLSKFLDETLSRKKSAFDTISAVVSRLFCENEFYLCGFSFGGRPS